MEGFVLVQVPPKVGDALEEKSSQIGLLPVYEMVGKSFTVITPERMES